MEYNKNRVITAHLSMLGANMFWGLMAPIGKAAMTHGLDGIDMVTFRVVGGAILFAIAALFAKKEHVSNHDKLMLFGAAIFGLVCNQCCFTIGLSLTSPINASIVTTSMPVFAMLLSALILHEPITKMKAGGVALGCTGAIILILTSATAANAKVGDIRGDLLCMCAQISYSFYLSMFNKTVRKYSPFTLNKWMFLFATIMLLPFTGSHVAQIEWTAIPTSTWLEAGYVVLIGTFVCYILMMVGQRTLRPTVVSIYNYMQPIVSVIVSIAAGLGIMKWSQALAVILVFTGVYLVSKSRSKNDELAKAENKD
ncbi:MAG: DMT family transporter [Prevotella sp.]|jgi:drug/metabolite transporter (DMT)-like permease|nr:DMT family transporter [Prevotella sp.]